MGVRRSLQETAKLVLRFERSARLPFGSNRHEPAMSKPEDIPQLSESLQRPPQTNAVPLELCVKRRLRNREHGCAASHVEGARP